MLCSPSFGTPSSSGPSGDIWSWSLAISALVMLLSSQSAGTANRVPSSKGALCSLMWVTPQKKLHSRKLSLERESE